MLAALVLLGGCAKWVPPTLQPDNVVPYTTEDGWEIDLRHYPGEGPPVLLVHGMGANHYNWDYREEVSLAYYLQQEGWDVWVPELRGDPGSRPPSKRAPKQFTFDDHALQDIPAALDVVQAITGEEQIYWVGHSMGGMLLYTALSRYPERIRAGVAVCSPTEFESLTGLHRKLRGLGWAMKGRGRIKSRFFASLGAPLGRANPLYGRLANRDNLEWPVANGMSRYALVDLPKPVVHQVTTWLKSGELLTVEGEPWLVPADVPILVMGGSVDRVVPEPNVAAACDLFPNCTYRQLGVEGGFSVDYGHIDPVMGRTARTEVYPVIEAFLSEHVDQGDGAVSHSPCSASSWWKTTRT